MSGRAVWQLNLQPEAMEIRLFWYTSGKGDQDTELIDTKRYQRIATTGDQEFSFTLPHQPYSFSGKLISLIWAVEAVFEPNGEVARAEFALGPEGKEVQLPNASP